MGKNEWEPIPQPEAHKYAELEIDAVPPPEKTPSTGQEPAFDMGEEARGEEADATPEDARGEEEIGGKDYSGTV